MSDIKRIDLNEFVEQGYLQEVNRFFFHPLGLALEVIVDKETGEVLELGGIWDYRDDPEGLEFGWDVLDEEKAHLVQEAWDEKESVRLRNLGFVIQPIRKPVGPPPPENFVNEEHKDAGLE